MSAIITVTITAAIVMTTVTATAADPLPTRTDLLSHSLPPKLDLLLHSVLVVSILHDKPSATHSQGVDLHICYNLNPMPHVNCFRTFQWATMTSPLVHHNHQHILQNVMFTCFCSLSSEIKIICS